MYTNKTISWQACKPQDMYGDRVYETAVNIEARHQPIEEVIKTSEGKEVLSKSYFYVAPKKGLLIKQFDKLNDELVISKYVMCDLHNKPKLVRFITI